jgi:Tol biopolymer transport system component/energy-coupling factor transporter ATP-binding protein EcfA2
MPDGKPRATLGDRQARGGVIGGKGYGFQAAYIVSRIPLWLADPDFVQFLQEGAGDVDVHFDRESGEERCYVQVKNYSVKPATAREVLAQFRETDEGSPGTYTLFTLACPGLHDRLKQLRGAVEELRGATPFFRPGEDPILDNTWADLERLVEKLNLPVDAGFLVDKVHFDTDLAGLRDDASLRRLFAGSLMELERWAAVPPEAVARAYEKLALKCHRALRETYAREQVEAVIQEAVEEVVPPRVISDVCPYRSLNAFTEADAEFFFGRQGAVSRLVESLRRESRFLAVLGPSGSGKSSLVQAGLIPELRTGAVPGSDRWGVIVTRPADHPFHGLEAQGLAGAGEELVGAVQTWLEGHPEQTRLVLVVDQFEELLVTSPRELRGAFVAQLVELLGADLAVTVLLVMRNDFYSRLDREAPALLAWLERGLVNVPLTLSRDDLRDIVEKPAQAVGLAFEPGLVDAILDDAMESAPAAEGRTGRSTVLPLLEFALSQLWERRRDGVLTHDAFKAIGGVTGGLMQWADRAFYRLKKEEHKQLARRVLTDLVHLGDESQGLPDSRRRRSLEDLCRSEEERETVRWVVRQLQLPDARLLATGRDLQSGQETVELIHDTLLREWGLLERWLKEDRIFLAWCQEIEGQVHAWVESAPDLPKRRDSERLLRGRALAVAERWLVERGEDLQDRVRSFIRASAARARRIRRLAVGGAGLALLIVSALAILFWGQRNAALDAQEVALARQLAAQSPQTLDRYPAQPSRSVLLAIESLRRYPESAANQALTDGLESLPREVARMTHDGEVYAVAFSPDGKRAVSGSRDGTARVWEAATGREVARMTHDGEVYVVAFSPDGRWVVSGGNDGTVQVWEAATGREVARMTHASVVQAVAFSPDGKWVVSGSWDTTARVWEAATGREVARMTHDGEVRAVAFSPGGEWVVSGGNDGTARVWEAATGREVARMTHDGEVRAVAFSPDGEWVVSGSHDGTARVWEAMTGREVARMTHDSLVSAVAFSPDGHWVVSGSSDDTARVWEAATGREVVRATHNDWVRAVAFSSDGHWVVSGSSDDTARVWEAATGREVARMTHDPA